MAFQWRYEDSSGAEVDAPETPVAEVFPSQADAETWMGENWRELLHAGIAQVTLLDGTREVYGPMSLSRED